MKKYGPISCCFRQVLVMNHWKNLEIFRPKYCSHAPAISDVFLQATMIFPHLFCRFRLNPIISGDRNHRLGALIYYMFSPVKHLFGDHSVDRFSKISIYISFVLDFEIVGEIHMYI